VSEILSERTQIFVRYVWNEELDEDDESYEMWLTADYLGEIQKGGKRYDKRSWETFRSMDAAFDFLKEYKTQKQAIAMAKRLGKIVDCGKALLEEGWEMEIVLSHEVTTRTVTCIEPAAPLVVLALQAD
jgi:hypothetical protein